MNSSSDIGEVSMFSLGGNMGVGVDPDLSGFHSSVPLRVGV